MVDVHSPVIRSRNMAAVRSRHTKPETLIRQGLHAAGFRFRLHTRHLPGKPDLVLPKYRAVVFVNGCFWHHHDCQLFKWPASREEFWRAKITRNEENDARVIEACRASGWRVALVWECSLKGKCRLDRGAAIQQLAKWITSDMDTITIRGTC